MKDLIQKIKDLEKEFDSVAFVLAERTKVENHAIDLMRDGKYLEAQQVLKAI